MLAIVQRVSRARVIVDERVVAKIGAGVLVLLGVGQGDTSEAAAYLAEKIAHLRIFDDAQGKMNRSLLDMGLDAGAAALVVSQFTLYGDARKGRRPDFTQAARPEDAQRLYQEFVASLSAAGVPVQTGVFQARMSVELTNDGPVTLLLDSAKQF